MECPLKEKTHRKVKTTQTTHNLNMHRGDYKVTKTKNTSYKLQQILDIQILLKYSNK